MSSHAPGLPPFAQVLKSRDVEDPVNLWVHRPLAYDFCWLIYPTSITPNQVTLLAIFLGLAAGTSWAIGTEAAMVAGGVLLWSSAIMDGADGILARAKNMQSAVGRALDGLGDAVVAAATVAAAIYHIVQVGMSWPLGVASAVALATTVLQLNLYDFYKELHLRQTRLDRGGESDTAAEAKRRRDLPENQRVPFHERVALVFYASYLETQERIIAATNPHALRLLTGVDRSEETAEMYRAKNALPMRFWMAVSLAPHCYLFSIAGMLDRLDLYIWMRLVLMNVLMIAGALSQRRATNATVRELESQGRLSR